MASSSSSLFLSIFLVLLISPALSAALSQECAYDKFTANKTFDSCGDLLALLAHLHFTYNSTNSSLSVAFKATLPMSGGWVAWALNLNGTGMAGAQAFVGWKSSGSSIVVKKFDIVSYSNLTEVSKLAFDAWDVSGESDSGDSLVIFASVKLSSLEKVNLIWQVGPSVANGFPAKHDFYMANLMAKGAIIDLTGTNASISASANSTTAGDSMTMAAKLAIAIGVTATLIICGLIYRSKIIPVIFAADFRRRNRDFEAFLRKNGPLSAKRCSFSEVKKMTNFFKDKLGQGGYGIVYKGKQRDHFVAVKVLNASKGEEGEEFINEVVSISRTSHVNIVSLLGFCLEGQKRALVYEFMPNGSLDKFLKIGSHLEWESLHQIAIGIARGLEYLHRGCNTRIVHFDIKPHNILLDENFCPKISDFGLAKLYTKRESILSMIEARGTIGYIAPEVFSRNFGGVSYKSDVYSYGMMVLEMVGRREKDEVVTNDTSSSENYFPNSFYKRLEMGNESEFYGEISIDEVEIVQKMTMVGLWCIQTNPSDRPSMSRVIEMLEGSSETLNIPPKPFHNSSVRKSPSLCSISTSIE